MRLGVALAAGQERTWPALLTATWEEQAAAASWSAVLSRAHTGTKLSWRHQAQGLQAVKCPVDLDPVQEEPTERGY